jgi:hypothetical protein
MAERTYRGATGMILRPWLPSMTYLLTKLDCTSIVDLD